MDTELKDGDYTLAEGEAGVWIAVDSIAVRVRRTDEGVVVDLYPNHDELSEPLASTYAFFGEDQE